MRYLVTIVMYLLALATTSVLALFLILIFAGPHSSALPGSWQPVVRVVAGLLVVVLPVLAARLAWRRAGRTPHRERVE